MGYYAKGQGSATLLPNINLNTFEIELEDFLKERDIDISFECFSSKQTSAGTKNIKHIEFWESGNFHEEDTLAFLERISLSVTGGCAVYDGEEDAHWRYVFDKSNKEWKEEQGKLVYDSDLDDYSEGLIIYEEDIFSDYTDEQLIEELSKRGYDVSSLEKDDREI